MSGWEPKSLSPSEGGIGEADSRGVSSERVLQTLMQKELIKESGRADTLGNPRLYMTTDKFLQVFNLSALSDLPPPDLASKGRRL